MTAKKPLLEQVLWWSMLFALGVFVALLMLDLIIRPWLPEEVAFVIGFALFYLLANHLLFGYGALSDFLAKLADDKVEDSDARKAYERSGAHKHGLLEQLTHFGLAAIWLDRYGPYRYAYLGLYLLLAAYVLVTNLDPVTGLVTGSTVEGLFWGATLVSVFVLAADVLVRWQYAQVIVGPVYAAASVPVQQTQKAQMSEQDFELAQNRVCPEPDDKACAEVVHQQQAEQSSKG